MWKRSLGDRRTVKAWFCKRRAPNESVHIRSNLQRTNTLYLSDSVAHQLLTLERGRLRNATLPFRVCGVAHVPASQPLLC